MISGNTRATSPRHQSVTAAMMPLASATGMKSPGGTRPRVGWRQRSSASNRLEDQFEQAALERAPQLVLQRERAERGLEALDRPGGIGRGNPLPVGAVEQRDRLPVFGQHDAQAHPQDRIGMGDAVRDLVGGDQHEPAIGGHARGGRARQVVEDRHLADDLAGPAPRQHHLAALAHQEYLDLAAVDEEGRRAGVAFGEQQRPGGKRDSVEVGVHGRSWNLRMRPERTD
jgi:hypothetical protein